MLALEKMTLDVAARGSILYNQCDEALVIIKIILVLIEVSKKLGQLNEIMKASTNKINISISKMPVTKNRDDI